MKKHFILILILISIFGLVNSQTDNNEITLLEVNMFNDDIVVEVGCSNDLVKIDFNLFDFDSNPLMDTNKFNLTNNELFGNVDCNILPIKYILKNKNLIEDKTYLINTLVKSGCVGSCNKSAYIYYSKQKQAAIPDNNIILIALIVSFVGFICTKKRI